MTARTSIRSVLRLSMPQSHIFFILFRYFPHISYKQNDDSHCFALLGLKATYTYFPRIPSYIPHISSYFPRISSYFFLTSRKKKIVFFHLIFSTSFSFTPTYFFTLLHILYFFLISSWLLYIFHIFLYIVLPPAGEGVGSLEIPILVGVS